MDFSTLKREPERVHRDLITLEDKKIMTKEGCKIYIPVRYQEQRLASIAAEVYILGIFAIVIDDTYYGVSKATTMVRIEPNLINTVKYEDSDYYEFIFEPGAIVIGNTEVVKNETLLYDIYNEFIAKGAIPWFINYEDLGRLFELAPYYNGMRLGANHAVIEMLAASISRDSKNMTKYYRHVVESKKDLYDKPPVVIKLNSVSYGATNTTAKLIGAYWDEGVTSALINPSDRVEPIEEILRR